MWGKEESRRAHCWEIWVNSRWFYWDGVEWRLCVNQVNYTSIKLVLCFFFEFCPGHDKEMIDGEVEKWLGGTFIVSPISSSIIAVVLPRLQITESIKKPFWSIHFWLHPLFPVAICPSFCSLVPYYGFWHTCLVLENHVSFFWFITQLLIYISAVHTSLISALASASRHSRYYQEFLILFRPFKELDQRTLWQEISAIFNLSNY